MREPQYSMARRKKYAICSDGLLGHFAFKASKKFALLGDFSAESITYLCIFQGL